MKKVLITGSNRGIGLELTKQLLQNGETVFATCREPAKASALAPQNEARPAMMGALEITSVEIYGELSPEVEMIVAGMKPLRRTAQIGTFEKKVAVKALIPV